LGASWAGTTKKGAKSNEFFGPDAKFRKSLLSGGDNPSAKMDTWALNRVRDFMKWQGLNTSIPFLELSRLQQRKILCEFFEGLKKKDGSMYPAGSVMNMLTSIGRAMRRTQEWKIVATGKYEQPFSWRDDALMRQVAWAAVLCMRRSREAGVGVKRKQASFLVFQFCYFVAKALLCFSTLIRVVECR
jgi:hypothetical protein